MSWKLAVWTLLSAFLVAGCGPSQEDIARNLASTNPAVREDTSKIAKNFGGEVTEAALVGVLADPIENVRLNAVMSLIELEAVSAVPFLMARLEVEPSPRVQREIVDALGRLGDRQAVPTLLAYLEARADEPPVNAIWALGNLGDPQALDALSLLRVSENVYVAYNANVALRKLQP
jgi:HEAT repeat protein